MMNNDELDYEQTAIVDPTTQKPVMESVSNLPAEVPERAPVDVGIAPSPQYQEQQAQAPVDPVEQEKEAYIGRMREVNNTASVSKYADARKQEGSGYNYRTYGDESDRWWETIKMGAAAFIMSGGNPAAALLGAFTAYSGQEDAQHRESQIKYLEEKGYAPEAIDAWVESGDNRYLAESPKKSPYLSVGGGLVFDTEKGVYLEQPGSKAKDTAELVMKDGSKVLIRIDPATQKPVIDPSTGKPEIVREVSLKTDKSGTGTGSASSSVNQFEELGLPQRVGKHQGVDGKTYEVKQSTSGKLYVAGVDDEGGEGDYKPTKLSAGSEKNRDLAYDTSTDLSTKADSFDAKAAELDELVKSGNYRSGIFGKGVSYVLGALGQQDDVEAAKSDYRALRNDAVIQAMPPGPASDNDIRIFSSGFPDDSWSGEKQAAWLRGRAKVMRYKADLENFKGDYYSKHNGLGMSDGKTFSEHRKAFIDNTLSEKYAPKGKQAPARDRNVVQQEAKARNTPKQAPAQGDAAVARQADQYDQVKNGYGLKKGADPKLKSSWVKLS